MDLKQLERFIVTADEGAIGAAAGRLGLSQPALTRSINMLETDVGAPLFERLPRGVRLTAVGQVLLPQAKLILRDRQRLASTVAELKGLAAGSLVFGATPNLVDTVGADAVLQFTKTHPKVVITVETGTASSLFENLQDGSLELALATVGSERVPDDLTLEPLFEQLLSIVVGRDHPLAQQPEVHFEELATQKWVVTNAAVAIDGLRRTFESRGVAPPFFNIRCQSLQLQKRLLLSGDYVGIVDQEVVQAELARGAVRVVATEGEGVWLKSGLLYRRDAARSPAASALAQFVRQGAQARRRPGGLG